MSAGYAVLCITLAVVAIIGWSFFYVALRQAEAWKAALEGELDDWKKLRDKLKSKPVCRPVSFSTIAAAGRDYLNQSKELSE